MNRFSFGKTARLAGPQIGLMISETSLRRVLGGHQEKYYCRYARYAREVGASLIFFAVPGLNEEAGTVAGYRHLCKPGEACTWEPFSGPIPRAIYERCFSETARPEALRLRKIARRLGLQVVNEPPKITKLMTFEALSQNPDLTDYLPYTAPMTAATLAQAMERFDDLYLKPDNLYKGKGVHRLTKKGERWHLQRRSGQRNVVRRLRPDQLSNALGHMLRPNTRYLVQEGLDLATYGGNRFDFRSLVQKNGQGRWVMTGLVARVAPIGGVITSPRSGGQVAQAEQALASLFGEERAPSIVAEIERVSLLLAAEAERHFGLCAELGLDLGVIRSGQIKLIEVNGKPMRVSLERLQDPLVNERIHRYPIHFAIHLAKQSAEAGQARVAGAGGRRPLVGVLLGPKALQLLEGSWSARYQQMMQEGQNAGTIPFIFGIEDLDLPRGWVNARVYDEDDGWTRTRLPLPDVVYHRAVYPHSKQTRVEVRAALEELALHHDTMLINPVASFSKLDMHTALTFFPATERLSPDTRPFSSQEDLATMLELHSTVFAKADEGSHGTEVVRIAPANPGWEVNGQIGGKATRETCKTLEQLHEFLSRATARRLWVLQQGIALPKVNGRICDLRVVVQKDGGNEWQVPLVLIRQGSAGKVAANMSQGGQPFLPDAFRERYGARAQVFQNVEEVAREAAMATAMALEARFGRLGEIGVDLAIDENGRPWILEANTKPVHPQVPGMKVPLVRYPFQYAVHLARRAWAGRQSGL
ncbi:MAG TPA: YheC/YheD family protein [Symbiobacteriaceae bacterium]|nr:YheC/YheD family protein [Symbiobacteriaceae bacterium]